MSNVINLNKFRKARAKSSERKTADANAARHGRSKAEKNRDATRKEAEIRHLDGHKRDKE